MEHHFTGPPYTLGVEEELMIVDRSTMDLVPAIEEMIEAVPHETEGQVKPELIQSVLEISTDVCRSAGEAAGQLEGPPSWSWTRRRSIGSWRARRTR